MKVREYGYEYDAVREEYLWEETRGATAATATGDVLLFRSGRDALKTIAREYTNAVVLMPALACESMILPFKMYGHELRYYRLTEHYSIEADDLEHLAEDEQRTLIFVYMDYFGNPAATDVQLDSLRIKHPKMVFVEDRTHNLLSPVSRAFQPDYTVASLRKWSNIPDGGLLWPWRKLVFSEFGRDTSFSEERLGAQCLRNQFFHTGDQTLKTKYRQIFSSVSHILDDDPLPCGMSAYAYALAQKTDWENLRACRRENARVLMDILKDCPKIHLIQNQPGLSDLYVAFTVDNRDAVQSSLAQLGVFCTVIWPLDQEQILACPMAAYTQAHMLAAPCDQRYTTEDMRYIGKEIVRFVNG